MRIFNGTNSQIDLPLANNTRLSIAAKTPSKDFAPNTDFLSLIVTSYDEHEIALIVGGPFELSMCATISAIAPLLVQSLDEAIERFAPKVVKPEPVEPEQKPEPKIVATDVKEDKIPTEEAAEEDKLSSEVEDSKETTEPKTKPSKKAKFSKKG